jgi:hypothetical protein
MSSPPTPPCPTSPPLRELRRSLLFSEELGIDLASRRDPELFRWFLASVLFGARITGTVAARTYRAFARHGLVTPDAILAAGWDRLVDPVMREGGYVRYDNRKTTQILRNCQTLLDDYQGSLTALHTAAGSPRDLERRLNAFHGVGPVTVNIFLRELRPYWRHADPEPLPVVVTLAARAGIDLDRYPRRSVTFARIEAGLLRARR